MKEQLEKRLTELKAELASGQKFMAELETKQANLRDTLLRISGAIQILEELTSTTEQNGYENHHEVQEESNFQYQVQDES
jgi:hypothetical protein